MSRGSRAVLAGLGGYGLLALVTGATLLAGSPPPAPLAPAAAVVAPGVDAGIGQPGQPPSTVPDAVPMPGPLASARQAAPAPAASDTFEPTTLILPNGTDAPVSAQGVAPDGGLIIPEDPSEVGMWDGGARPGDPLGSMVIAGHVDSRKYGLGVLYQIKGVAPGAVVELRDANRRARYVVTSTRSVNQQSLATDDEFFRQDVPHRLVLITCGGPFDPVRRSYRDNYIVLARPA